MVKMGLIGAGTMGAYYALAFRQCKASRLVAVCDLDQKKAKALARKFGESASCGASAAYGAPAAYGDYEKMLRNEELDAVTVATPDFAHRAPVLACLAAGKHVLCEKPLATTIRDCEAIGRAVRRSGLKLMVNFGNRHRPNVRLIKSRVAAGNLGRIENVFIRLREQLKKTRTLAWAARTTPTFFLLSHCTDTVRWIIGGMPERVYATATYGALRAEGIDVPDAVVAVLTFDNGAVVTMDANWAMPDGFEPSIDFGMEVIGDKGAVYADLYPRDLMEYTRRTKGLDHSLGAVDPMGRQLGWWLNSVYYFVECVERGVEPEPDAEDGLNVTRTLLAIEKSVKTGRVVKVV